METKSTIPCPVCGSVKTYHTDAIHCNTCATTTEIYVELPPISSYEIRPESFTQYGFIESIHISKHIKRWLIEKPNSKLYMSKEDGCFYGFESGIRKQPTEYIMDLLFDTPTEAYECYLKFHKV